jgi:tetratricopeptide (TPR) repeat protein
MTIPGQPPASPALQQALTLLEQGKLADAENALRKVAGAAKAKSGSGSHPLSLAYADLARLHYRAGDYKKSATEFRHVCEAPMPPDPAARKDRLAFMFGFAASVEAAGALDAAEKAYRQCVAFARNLFGLSTPGYAAALEPLASVLLKSGKTAEAMQLLDEAYDTLWKHGDPQVTGVIPTRAEALKAAGRADNPFADLTNLPDELVAATVTHAAARPGRGDPPRVRQALADLLKFLDKRYGDGHPTSADVLATIARHEAGLGDKADAKSRATATRRAIWSYAVRRVPGGLLENLEVGFEPGGTIHLVPHLSHDPAPAEVAQLETVLTQAVDELYTRMTKK